MSEGHEQQADKLEREADGLAHESERVKGNIEDARSDWERKKADESVPGAGGDPVFGEGDGPPEDDDQPNATLSES